MDNENICVINAMCGIGTSSPQIARFSHNCSTVKFIIDKDFSDCAVVIITSIDGNVTAVSEGDALEKSYSSDDKKTTLLWHPTREVTATGGCVIYQIVAYSTDDEIGAIWYSKEGRLIVSDSIDTADMSTALVGSYPNLVMQILTKVTAANNLCLELASALGDDPNFATTIMNLLGAKVDKTDGKDLSTNDYTTAEKLKLASLENYDDSDILTVIYDLQRNKVEKIAGKGLSTNDYTDAEKTKLASLENYDDSSIIEDISALQNSKVDKEDGMGLSTNDYTTEEKEKLASLINYDDTTIQMNIDAVSAELGEHKADSANPHGVTKLQIGLGNADNTSDMDKPMSTATKSYVDSLVGDIETALDSIIDIQNSLIGGNA